MEAKGEKNSIEGKGRILFNIPSLDVLSFSQHDKFLVQDDVRGVVTFHNSPLEVIFDSIQFNNLFINVSTT